MIDWQPLSGGPVREFHCGDRVRLRVATAENWVDPKIRRRAADGRTGTITAVVGTALRASERSYRVNFDQKGKEKPLSDIFFWRDLEEV